jgi:natural product biosynthesis luciferase-like monooxygenase protein
MAEHQSIIHALRQGAERHPEAPALSFVDGNLDVVEACTYGELEARITGLAALLEDRFQPGSRFVLLHPPGLAALEAFLGCVAAGMIAVPAYPPDPFRLARTMARLVEIARDCAPSALLTESFIGEHRDLLLAEAPELATLPWIETDGRRSTDGCRVEHEPVGDETAFIQYSSGSTGVPKGVVVSHANIEANVNAIVNAFALRDGDTGFSWLPTYHDMGLVGAVLAPLHQGFHSYLVSPIDFLRDPTVWVRAMSRFGCTVSGGPNFAFDLVARRCPDEILSNLDLSMWRIAFNGAEPINPSTLQRFVRRFEPAGFSASALLPCYGLAEATLLVAGSGATDVARILYADVEELAGGRIVTDGRPPGAATRRLVSCGRPASTVAVRITEVATGAPLAAGEVGQIEVAGPSVATSYWRRPELTGETFVADDDRTWLRTGDLGALVDGELVPVGRQKDTLIVRGRTMQPQDVEWLLDDCHPSIRPGCAAVFAADPGADERAVLVVEVDDACDRLTDVADAVARAGRSGSVEPASVVLVARKGIPKTSSGKVRRSEARERWRDGTIDAVFEHRFPVADPTSSRSEAESPRRSPSEVAAWFRAELRDRLGDDVALDDQLALADLGLDSEQLVEMHVRLEEWLGRPVELNEVWANPTIGSLAAALGGQRDDDRPGDPDRPTSRVGDPDDAPTTPVVGGAAPDGAPPRETAELIEIIGIGIRVGAAVGPRRFGDMLRDGDRCRQLAPRRRADDREALGRFDARFFGLSPREVRHIDPQHRWFLETAWQAIEDAGIDPRSLAGSRTGVFLGASPSGYDLVALRSGADPTMHSVTGLSPAIGANRLSYLLDLRGPSLTVDTACSSSLVALDLAVTSLRNGACDLAIVGGVNLVVSDEITSGLSTAGAMSPTGACHTFDAAADGYVRGEGCGVIVLEPTSAAARHGRRAYARVGGTAVGQDGHSNGLTAPNPDAQREVILAALRAGGHRTDEVVAIEAHGTGTPLGDPIEIAALASVFSENEQPVRVTSVKSLVGHLEAAAGITGVIRTALAAHHRTLPAHANLETLNPSLDLAGAVTIPTSATRWEHGLVGVSSFGFGGTNAHAVLALPTRRAVAAPAIGVCPVSAHTAEALRARLGQVAELADRAQDVGPEGESAAIARLAPIAGRHRYRAVVDGDAIGLASRARELASTEAAIEPVAAAPRLAFVVAGQGAGTSRAGTPLAGTRPGAVAATGALDGHGAHLRLLLAAVGPVRGRSLEDWAGAGGTVPTEVLQPLLTAQAIAAAATLRRAGLEPDVVLGHSAGEIAALAIAGGLDDEAAVALAAARGAAMAELMPAGAMAAVLAGPVEVAELLASSATGCVIAASNGRRSTVISGSASAVDAFAQRCRAQGYRTITLATDRAFHSSDVDACLDRLLELGVRFPARDVTSAFVSTVDGTLRSPGWRPPDDHWWRHARQPVRFDAALRAIDDRADTTFLELGPGSTLAGLRRGEGEHWVSLPFAAVGNAAAGQVLGALYEAGQPVDWNIVVPGAVPDLDLDPYPFVGDVHWVQPQPDGSERPTKPEPTSKPSIRARPPAPDIDRTGSPAPDAAASLRFALAGFGAGPGSTVVIDGLGQGAEDVAIRAVLELGARWCRSGSADDRPGALHVIHDGRDAGAHRAVPVDADGRTTAALDLHRPVPRRSGRPRLSLAFFGLQARGRERDAYRSMIDAARVADELGLAAIWTPERHFDRFGGAFPSPAVIAAALATQTSTIGLRAGSVVLPLTRPARMVEEWALVDNLSGGRVGVAIASGWRDRDRLLAPSAERPDLEQSIDEVRRLWRGETVTLRGAGDVVGDVQVQPAPVQPELPIWLTVMSNPASWALAARLGVGVFTNMIGRSLPALTRTIAEHRSAAPRNTEVAVMLHAHVEAHHAGAQRRGGELLEHYLAESAALFAGADHTTRVSDRLATMSEHERAAEVRAVAKLSAPRYLDGCSLIGDPGSCAEVLDAFGEAGVTEVACLVDFGPSPDEVLATIRRLAALNDHPTAPPRPGPTSGSGERADQPLVGSGR